MYWFELKEKCVHRVFDTKHGYLCHEPGRLSDPVGIKGCVERYCPEYSGVHEDVEHALELLGIEIDLTNKKFKRMFEVKSLRCKHRKIDDTISPDECLCSKGKGIGENFCSIYSCPIVNKEE